MARPARQGIEWNPPCLQKLSTLNHKSRKRYKRNCHCDPRGDTVGPRFGVCIEGSGWILLIKPIGKS